MMDIPLVTDELEYPGKHENMRKRPIQKMGLSMITDSFMLMKISQLHIAVSALLA